MAWPETLTASQQTTVENFVTDLPTWAAALAKLNLYGAALGSAWYGGLSTLVGALQTSDVIPNISGLADSGDLTAAHVTTLVAWVFALSNPANSDQGTGAYARVGIQQLCALAAGINAVSGN